MGTELVPETSEKPSRPDAAVCPRKKSLKSLAAKAPGLFKVMAMVSVHPGSLILILFNDKFVRHVEVRGRGLFEVVWQLLGRI
jgi:hypothetical protein